MGYANLTMSGFMSMMQTLKESFTWAWQTARGLLTQMLVKYKNGNASGDRFLNAANGNNSTAINGNNNNNNNKKNNNNVIYNITNNYINNNHVPVYPGTSATNPNFNTVKPLGVFQNRDPCEPYYIDIE